MIGLGLSALALAVGGVVLDRRADWCEARAEATYPPTGRFIDVEGQSVHVHIEGEGPDLVLIHGASGNTRDFTFGFARRMSRHFRVVIFDRPGLGWSARPSNRFGGAWNTRAESPREQARFLQAAADQLGLSNPVVLGHSYGGAVALAWALERPETTAALVVLSGASNPWPGRLGPLYPVMASALGGALLVPLLTAFEPQERIEATTAEIFAPDPVPPGYTRHVGAPLTLRRESLRANARQVNSLRPHVVEMSRAYPSLTLPVEIVHGTADTVVPLTVHAEPLARQIPNAVLTRLDGIGHMPHHIVPDEVEEAVLRAATRAGVLA